MPRTFSTAIQGEIDKQFAGEPMVMVEIAWNGTDFVAYTDRKLQGIDYPHPFVHSIGMFDTTTVIDGSSDSQSVSLVLNDIDGSIRKRRPSCSRELSTRPSSGTRVVEL
jgi:hypothetical protein